jgi:hypothetical protein
MTVGSPTQGADGLTKHKGLRFTCLDNKSTRFPEVSDFPTKPCKGGLMTEHHFPALGIPAHQNNVSLYANYD